MLNGRLAIEWAFSLCNFLVRLFSYQIALWRVLFFFFCSLSPLSGISDTFHDSTPGNGPHTKDTIFSVVSRSVIHTARFTGKKTVFACLCMSNVPIIDMLCSCSTTAMNHRYGLTHMLANMCQPLHKNSSSNIGEPASIIQSTHTHTHALIYSKANK